MLTRRTGRLGYQSAPYVTPILVMNAVCWPVGKVTSTAATQIASSPPLVFRRDIANGFVGDNWNRNRVALGLDVAASKDAADRLSFDVQEADTWHVAARAG